MLRWTNTSPGAMSTIWLAGTRESEQPIHRNFGVWIFDSRRKKSGSSASMREAQASFFSSSSSSRLIGAPAAGSPAIIAKPRGRERVVAPLQARGLRCGRSVRIRMSRYSALAARARIHPPSRAGAARDRRAAARAGLACAVEDVEAEAVRRVGEVVAPHAARRRDAAGAVAVARDVEQGAGEPGALVRGQVERAATGRDAGF